MLRRDDQTLIAFMSQPLSMNSVASQSSSSGCEGAKPCDPKSSRGFHNAAAEDRLPEMIHCYARRQRIIAAHQPFAKPSRLGGASAGNPPRKEGTSASTRSPLPHRLPSCVYMSRDAVPCCLPLRPVPWNMKFFDLSRSSAIFWRTGASSSATVDNVPSLLGLFRSSFFRREIQDRAKVARDIRGQFLDSESM